jgi:metal-responsive CopG/Arc/MetJ family transcriptional regulator
MKPLRIQLDERTLAALNRIASPAERKRSEFIRQAIRQAIRQTRCDAMREAYLKQPDSILVADDWSTAENYKL